MPVNETGLLTRGGSRTVEADVWTYLSDCM